jgi:UDP-N-acetylglucosamine--N-acetylmuramyl-(pentapeptide) pyrophosphoryl-undecaprenol N-acetylglucosamine transferase
LRASITPFKTLNTSFALSTDRYRRNLPLDIGYAKDVFKVLKGVIDARKVLKREKPDLLFSKGGFVQ